MGRSPGTAVGSIANFGCSSSNARHSRRCARINRRLSRSERRRLAQLFSGRALLANLIEPFHAGCQGRPRDVAPMANVDEVWALRAVEPPEALHVFFQSADLLPGRQFA